MRKLISFAGGLILLLALILVWNLSAVVVHQHEQVVITEFGAPVRFLTQPGLYFKTPFIQDVRTFEKRVIIYDSGQTDAITRDKKTLVVDNYALYRIKDLETFISKVRSESERRKVLDDIIYSALRVEVARHDLIDVVDKDRETLTRVVTETANTQAQAYGLEIMDVRIKRAELPTENQASVYERMRSERKRQATQYRSEGEEEAAKIRAETDKQRSIILAEAYNQAQQIRGEGEAEATRIYTEALSQDPEFYAFIRTMEAYQKSFQPGHTKLILTPDSELLKYLRGPNG